MISRKFAPCSVMIASFAAWLLLFPAAAGAHCDRENGPVARDAREALATGKVDKVAIWVGPEQETELQEKFRQARAAYQLGGDAKAVAEQYFMETAVRLHRQAEGFPYTGLKRAQPVAEDIAVAEKALETGDLKPVTDLLAAEMRQETEKLFHQARAAAKNKDESLAAGREWADAYVQYIIFVHGLHQKIEAGPAHGVGEE